MTWARVWTSISSYQAKKKNSFEISSLGSFLECRVRDTSHQRHSTVPLAACSLSAVVKATLWYLISCSDTPTSTSCMSPGRGCAGDPSPQIEQHNLTTPLPERPRVPAAHPGAVIPTAPATYAVTLPSFTRSASYAHECNSMNKVLRGVTYART